ncbi:putative CTD phosphatase-like protein [Scale drop disease virus]|uniref:ORF_099L n=1 Tax=Scale drop disease virus TaxID=1697349 RepID=A0A0K1L6K5_9VIRU|nr:ORF_099L [Scale drop disease virus]AKU37514.1 ORF_099L [Scale drop disease virus]QLI60773.1 putative CTD phosphatase-like protein [Scale drop disease virus]QXJ13691.1 ORF099L [Scale drop disease virus]UNH60682.1 putative CTD phosphatase-like protein [Scale drop disease virus]
MLTVLLDLDHTLIESIETSRLSSSNAPLQRLKHNVPEHDPSAEKLAKLISKVEWHNIPGFIVCVRPHVQTLIKTLYLNGYNVGVWTAANADYARDIVTVLGLSTQPLSHILYDVHDKTGTKPLQRIFGKDLSHVFIIDDNPNVKRKQKNNCFLIKPFYVENPNAPLDVELLRACTFLAEKTHSLQ